MGLAVAGGSSWIGRLVVRVSRPGKVVRAMSDGALLSRGHGPRGAISFADRLETKGEEK